MAIAKKNQLVGLDIGSHSIKVVEIDHSKRGRILKNFGLIPVPRDAIVEGSIKDEDGIVSAVRRLFRNLGIRNQNVAVGLSGYSVFSKRISLAVTDESEVESAIQEEAEKYIPFDINDVNVDFAVLPPETGTSQSSGSGDAETMDVMLVAAKTSVIDEYVHMFEMAGINPCVLDVDILAIQNALELSVDDPTKGHFIVHVGARELGINVISNGFSIFSRDSSNGGAHITESISAELDVDYDKAERIKLGANKTPLDKKDLEIVRDITSSVVTSWVREVRQALDFVFTTFPDETIDEILVGGGSCRIPGFQDYLSLETEVPVKEINPLRSLRIDPKAFDPEYMRYMAPQLGVAVGLGLRSIRDK